MVLPFVAAAAAGCGIGAGISYGSQVYRNYQNSNLTGAERWTRCIDLGDVAISCAVGAVGSFAGAVGFSAGLAVFGTGFWGFTAAGSLSGILGGLYSRGTAAAITGDMSLIGTGWDIARDAALGGILSAAGYGISSWIDDALRGLDGNFGVPDEFLPPSATGQYLNWESPLEQAYYLSGGGDNFLLDNWLAYKRNLTGLPSSMPEPTYLGYDKTYGHRWSDGGYLYGRLSPKEVSELKALSAATGEPITIAGGLAETERGVANRIAALREIGYLKPAPEYGMGTMKYGKYEDFTLSYRNTGPPSVVPGKTRDVDIWTPRSQGRFTGPGQEVRKGLEEIFGVKRIDNYNKHWGFETPPGTITFDPQGNVSRVLAPWQIITPR